MSKRPAEEEREDVCSFFLAKKKRSCRMKTLEGMTFCPHHSHLGSDLVSKRGPRIPCPLDSSHFCYESKLQKHLKICNARDKEKPNYFVENANLSSLTHDKETKLSLNDVSDDELMGLIEKIKTIYDGSEIVITDWTSQHPLLQSEMENSEDKLNTFKHMRQQAALLSVMEEKGLLGSVRCFVEFGAGKGQLMYWIIKCTPESEKSAFILVDKSAQRHKSDNKFKGTDVQIQRMRIDIQNLFLGKIETIQDKLDQVVGVSKHLCGAATDLALKCMMDTLVHEKEGERVSHRALGLLMALCCHHRCTWNSYVGQHFMNSHNISKKEFQIMCCIVSWATCGLRKLDESENEHKKTENLEGNQDSRYKRLDLQHEEREKIGLKCKSIMDLGRAFYLKEKGYNVSFIKYIDKSVSLENIALLAVRVDS